MSEWAIPGVDLNKPDDHVLLSALLHYGANNWRHNVDPVEAPAKIQRVRALLDAKADLRVLCCTEVDLQEWLSVILPHRKKPDEEKAPRKFRKEQVASDPLFAHTPDGRVNGIVVLVRLFACAFVSLVPVCR